MNQQLKQFLDGAFTHGHRIFVTPISAEDLMKTGSNHDYQEEMKSIQNGGDHRWNGEATGRTNRYTPIVRNQNLPSAGWPFVYLHQNKTDLDGGVAEFYEVVRTGPSSESRDWWLDGSRDVIHLGVEKKGECSIRELCEEVIQFTFKSGPEHGRRATRFAGNRIYNWNNSYSNSPTVIKTKPTVNIDKLSPKQFENFVLDLYKDKGYNVTETPHRGDHGVDGYVEKSGHRSVVQCKKAESVGEPILRDLLGTVVAEGCDGGILVTTGILTRRAQQWLRSKNHTFKIKVVLRHDLERMVR